MLTVVTPAASWKLTTAENLKAELGITGSAEDTRLGRLIGRASDMIVGHCDRGFARETVQQDFPCPWTDGGLRLDGGPVEVLSVTAAGATLLATEWQFDAEDGRIYRLSPATGQRIVWPALATSITFRRGYVLPGETGYDAAGIFRLPGDVEQACITIASGLRAGGPRDPMLRSESTEGVGSASYIATADMAALPPQATSLLERYVRVSFA